MAYLTDVSIVKPHKTQSQTQETFCCVCVKKILRGLERSQRHNLLVFEFIVANSFSFVCPYRYYYTIR